MTNQQATDPTVADAPGSVAPEKKRRAPALLIALLLFALGIGSTWIVASRLAEHQRLNGRTIYVFNPVVEPAFEYAGNAVTIESIEPTEAQPLGSVRVTYGDASFDLLVPFEQRTHAANLPGLVEHEDWLRVLRFAPLTGHSPEEFVRGIESGEIPDRLCVVARIPRQGADAATWGRIWKRDWTFGIHELLPDGTIRTERFAYPQGRPYDEAPPTEVGGLPVLQPDTWQYDASLYVMPTGSTPKIRIIDSALRAVGWPFAAAVVFFSLATAAAVIAFVPTRQQLAHRFGEEPSTTPTA